MPRDWDELDEDELRELAEAEDAIPRRWQPGPETVRAIEGEARVSDRAEDVVPSVADSRDIEEMRLDAAAERLNQIEWLKPETWGQLDEYQRRVALDLAGRELADVYHCPEPPVLFDDAGDPNLRGEYRDDDYYIKVNRAAEVDYDKLLGDDATEALRTYAHEFRHSYQVEQATRYDKPQFRNLVDNPGTAKEWSENLRDYKAPDEDYDVYRNQPVERDARGFADNLVRRVYG